MSKTLLVAGPRGIGKTGFVHLLSRVFLMAVLCAFTVTGCATEATPTNPITKFKTELASYPQYAVVLADMKSEGVFSPSYFHKYKVTKATYEADSRGDSLLRFDSDATDWRAVPKNLYDQHKQNLGMTLLAKTPDGALETTPFPPGYQYVGNPQYGQWQTKSDGTSFWEFYGQYMLISQLFDLGDDLIDRKHYNRYRTYRRSNRPYYGGGRYGTSGTTTAKRYKSSSAIRTRSKSFSGSNTSRSNGRRSAGSATRSRSRSFGK